MSTILKNARWEFLDGSLKNHWGFVGEGMGAVIDAIEFCEDIGRYEKVGKGVEEDPDGFERVVYELVHVPSEQFYSVRTMDSVLGSVCRG